MYTVQISGAMDGYRESPPFSSIPLYRRYDIYIYISGRGVERSFVPFARMIVRVGDDGIAGLWDYTGSCFWIKEC